MLHYKCEPERVRSSAVKHLPQCDSRHQNTQIPQKKVREKSLCWSLAVTSSQCKQRLMSQASLASHTHREDAGTADYLPGATVPPADEEQESSRKAHRSVHRGEFYVVGTKMKQCHGGCIVFIISKFVKERFFKGFITETQENGVRILEEMVFSCTVMFCRVFLTRKQEFWSIFPIQNFCRSKSVHLNPFQPVRL